MSSSRRVIMCCLLIVASWLGGAVFVRVSLDLVDSTPYSATSEVWYITIAIAAVAIAVSGSVTSIVWARRR